MSLTLEELTELEQIALDNRKSRNLKQIETITKILNSTPENKKKYLQPTIDKLEKEKQRIDNFDLASSVNRKLSKIK